MKQLIRRELNLMILSGVITFLVTLLVILIFNGCSTAHAENHRDVGEPRTVRLVYVNKIGKPTNQEIVNKMKVDIIRAQQFFAQQLEQYGYGYREFRVERDTDGTPLVHTLQAVSDRRYLSPVVNMFDTQKNIYVVLYDNGKSEFNGIGGFASIGNHIGGIAVIPTYYYIITLYHELGHTFRLEHSRTRDEYDEPADAMGHLGDWPAIKITECYARSLAIHPYFNDDTPHDITIVSSRSQSAEKIDSINITLPETYTVDDESIEVIVNVNNPNGVYQVLLHTQDLFVECKHGDGSTNATFKFEFKGYKKGTRFFKLNEFDKWLLNFTVIDMKSNYYIERERTTRKPLEDVNQDDVINVLDLIIVSNHISNGTFDQLADVNQDGTINILDLVQISQKLQEVK